MNNFSLIHKITIYVMEELKNHLELFLQSQDYFSAFYWVLKGFSKNPLFPLQFYVFKIG
jgi:hypothetical protein